MVVNDAVCIKLMLVGDTAAGKSSLLARYVDDKFHDTFMSTIGIDFRLKTISVGGRAVKLQIWDTAGQERFRTITASYYRGAQGILLIYDVSNRVSFLHLERWHAECQRYAEAPSMVVVGTKTDAAAARRQVSAEEAEAWAAAHDCAYIECSAKDPSSVATIAALFAELARRCLARLPPKPAAPLLEPSAPAQRRRQCC